MRGSGCFPNLGSPPQTHGALRASAVGGFVTPRVFSTEQALRLDLFSRIFPQRLQPSEFMSELRLRLRRVLPR